MKLTAQTPRRERLTSTLSLGIVLICVTAAACYKQPLQTEAEIKRGQSRCAGEEVAEVSNRTTDPVDILFSDGKVITMLQPGVGLGTTTIPLPRPGTVYAQFNGQIVSSGISVRLLCRAR